ncbi:MAG: DUF4923 family protein [Bacteroidaceae bacterium]|nr:DUF4923 family protein [Bacteroidaceae bacterium]
MKKLILVIALFMSFAMNGQAQAWKNVLGKVANKVVEEVADEVVDTDNSLVSNVLGTLIGNSLTFSKSVLVGTWNYEGAACVLESENALADIGGSVATSKIEETLDGYLAKVGVKSGACSFTFMENDSCCFTVNGRDIRGTYKLDVEEKRIDFSFLREKLNMKSYVSYNVTDVNLVFDADKLLDLIKNVTSSVSDKTSTLSSISSASSSTKLSTATATLNTVSTLVANYDGMMLGMKLKK